MSADTYDIVITGGGAAGLTAGLYAARARLRTLLLDKGMVGGQIALTDRVENYPGFPDGISGTDLSILMHQQATKFGMETEFVETEKIILDGDYRIARTEQGDYRAKAIIVTSGSEHKKLGVPGEMEYSARGVSYCAVCDGAFFKDEVLGVVGGGDAALDEGMFLTKFASKVIVIHRRDQLRASQILQERAFANSKIEFIWDTVVESIAGNAHVESLNLLNIKTEDRFSRDVGGVFIYIGLIPNSALLGDLVKLDNGGHVRVNDRMETGVPGLYAAGDIRQNSARQVVSAAGDGGTAALAAEKYISERNWN